MPFNNPVVAGEVLAIPGIQSTNYVAGSAGWRVEADGDAELNDATLRGGLTVTDGTSEIVIDASPSPFILLDSPAVEKRIFMLASAPSIGISDYGDSPENHGSITGAGAGSGTFYEFIFTSSSTGDTTSDFIEWVLRRGSTIAANRALISGPIVSRDPNSKGNDETWTDLPLSNGWAHFGAGYKNGQYRYMPDGTVLLRGNLDPGTLTDGTVIFTLPAGYRPTGPVQYAPRCDATSHLALFQINTDGTCQVFAMAGATAVALDGIRFDLSTIE